MKKPDTTAAPAGAAAVEDAATLAKLPNLCEHLSADTWDDGSSRERSTLTLFVEAGLFKAALNDRTMGQSLYRTAKSPDQALALLEKALATGSADWRVWKGGSKRK